MGTIPGEVLRKLIEDSRHLETREQAAASPTPSSAMGRAAGGLVDYSELMLDMRELFRLNRSMEGVLSDKRLPGQALADMLAGSDQSVVSRAQWVGIQASASFSEYAAFFVFHFESFLRAFEVLASCVISRGEKPSTSIALDELSKGQVASAVCKVKFDKKIPNFSHFAKQQLAGLPSLDLAGIVLDRTFLESSDKHLSLVRISLLLRRIGILQKTMAPNRCRSFCGELARLVCWCRSHGFGGGLTQEVGGAAGLSRCQALLDHVGVELRHSSATTFGMADAVRAVQVLLCGDQTIDRLLDECLLGALQTGAQECFEGVVKALAAKVFEVTVQDLSGARTPIAQGSVPGTGATSASEAAPVGGAADDPGPQGSELHELVRGLGLVLRVGELEMVVEGLTRLGFDDIESLSIPTAYQTLSAPFLQKGLEASGMGLRAAGVSIKVVTKLAEFFGWGLEDPSQIKSAAMKEDIVRQGEAIKQLEKKLERQTGEKRRLEQELAHVKKAMIRHHPRDTEVLGSGGGSLGCLVQSQAHAQGADDRVTASAHQHQRVQFHGSAGVRAVTRKFGELELEDAGPRSPA